MDRIDFLETVILKRSCKLNRNDLEILYTLSKEYDVVRVLTEFYYKDILTLIGWLIINELPYRIGSKFVIGRQLINPLVTWENNHLINTTTSEYVEFHVQRMNKLLYES